MRRWNGWGSESTIYPLPPSAAAYLEKKVGPGQPRPDCSLEDVLPSIPPSKLSPHPLIIDAPLDRLLHARGQSLPDWAALRSGQIERFPDGVAYPTSEDEVKELIHFTAEQQAHLIPYGGGTSVVGHITPLSQGQPVLTVDLSRMNQLISLNETDQLATFGAGINGPDLEAQLNQAGYTLGHFPQSFELSTLGGWIATRSSGQQSYAYGRIEDLFAGGRLISPMGVLNLPRFPASAAGPDIRHMVLGSEGRLGILTQATVRIRPIPPVEKFYGVFFKSWAEGSQALHQLAQERIGVSMARLSDAQETETTLILSGKDSLVAWANRSLGWIGYGEGRCLLVFGITGSPSACRQAYQRSRQVFSAHGGLFTGTMIGHIWQKSRFLTPYLRNTLWEVGYALDTLETAVPWSAIPSTAASIQAALRAALQDLGEQVLVFSHLSHIYRDGASIYTTYLFRQGSSAEETVVRWHKLKGAASQALVKQGGTISHQHGVGIDHAPYLAAEKGEVGMELLRAVAKSLDPQGIMNPGKLLS